MRFAGSVLGEDAKHWTPTISGGAPAVCRSTERAERNEVDSPIILDGHEGIPLDFARLQQASVGPGELLVAIAGMAGEFERAFGHGGDERMHCGDFDRAGCQDAHRAVGSFKTLFLDDAAKTRLKAAEQDDFSASDLRCVRGCVQAPDRLEGVADCVDARGFGRAEHRAQNAGEHVQVLVGVNVRETNSETLQQGYLCSGFGFDVCTANARCEEALQEAAQSGIKAAGDAIDEGRDGASIRDGRAVDEDDMAAYAECRHGEGHFDGFFSGGSLCHERSAGEHFSGVKLEDGAIDPGSEPEVVRIHDKSGHED